MMFFEKMRIWISKNLAPLIFLSAYFFTTVLGNLIYSTPFGRERLESAPYMAKIINFNTLFSPGYWILLFIPFFVVPLVVMGARKVAGKYIERRVGLFPEFSRFEYSFVVFLFYLFLLYSMFEADAFSLFASGNDSVASVETRFQIRTQLGFLPLMVLMSIMHYLSIYSLVRWMTSDGFYWKVASVLNAFVMSVFLVLLNMKWPVLIFYAGLVLAVFVYAKRYAYFKAFVGAVLLVSMYLMISVFVFRTMPNQDRPHSATLVQLSLDNAPELLFNVVNRMAIIYPYYYQIFTEEGQVCGGIMVQAKVAPACRPSTFVYTRIFNDSFNGRGTAPAAVHVSGYALGGWPVALFALLCASVVLGLLASLPLYAGAGIGSVSITGAIVGYHFSQLPGEGPIFYEHGIFWVFVFLGLFKFWRLFSKRLGMDRIKVNRA